MRDSQLDGYHGLRTYFGDIHNHCEVSYGKGPLGAAFRNARLQLDFLSVTVHADWPDLPKDDRNLDYLVEYHSRGFKKAVANWPEYLKAVEQESDEGKFVVFPSFEWHSNEYGDYCVYFRDTEGASILRAKDLKGLRSEAAKSTPPAILLPHHIGYKTGARGINWGAFEESLSPVVEIFSFHGLSETSEGPYPYMHSMGPVHEHGTAQYGWEQGHRFGVVGSSDHHNAFPGSYGYGRMGVWAEDITRESIWNALVQRRTYALTGDRIDLAFSVNGQLMGDICPPARKRKLAVEVRGGGALDCVDVLHNNRVIHRENIFPGSDVSDHSKVYVEVGWGEGFESYAWDVELEVVGGTLEDVEPRFRGFVPAGNPDHADFAATHWKREGNTVHFQTRTRPNISSRIPQTAGMSLEISGAGDALVRARINGKLFEASLSDLGSGSRSFYMGGFVSPAVCFHRAVPEKEYMHRFEFTHEMESGERDWYYVRVRQRNDQYAWSSPVWVSGTRD